MDFKQRYFIKKNIDGVLAMCTNDFAKGDIITFYSKGYPERDVVDHFEPILPLGVAVGNDNNNYIHLSNPHCYRELALIDPEDVWVTEDMEFDRNDFECVWKNEFGEQSLCLYDINKVTENCFIRIKFNTNVKY